MVLVLLLVLLLVMVVRVRFLVSSLVNICTAMALGIGSLRMDNHCTLTRWYERWCCASPTSRGWSTTVEPPAIKRLMGTISWTH